MSCGCQERRKQVAQAVADRKPIEAVKQVVKGAAELSANAARRILRKRKTQE